LNHTRGECELRGKALVDLLKTLIATSFVVAPILILGSSPPIHREGSQISTYGVDAIGNHQRTQSLVSLWKERHNPLRTANSLTLLSLHHLSNSALGAIRPRGRVPPGKSNASRRRGRQFRTILAEERAECLSMPSLRSLNMCVC